MTADLRGAVLRLASIGWAAVLSDRQELRTVNLTGADLREATFNGADLSGADLAGAVGRYRCWRYCTRRSAATSAATRVRPAG